MISELLCPNFKTEVLAFKIIWSLTSLNFNLKPLLC